jgi:hypothetical protein
MEVSPFILAFQTRPRLPTSLSKKPTRSDLPTHTHTQWLTTRVLSKFICSRERFPRRSRPRRVDVHLLQPSLREKDHQDSVFREIYRFPSQIEFGTPLAYLWVLLGTSGATILILTPLGALVALKFPGAVPGRKYLK